MSSKEVWTPELQFIYAYDDPIITKPIPARLIDQTNKIISQRYRTQITLRCDMNFDDFPFDTQVCELRFGSWMHTKAKIDFEFDSPTNNKTGHGIISIKTLFLFICAQGYIHCKRSDWVK